MLVVLGSMQGGLIIMKQIDKHRQEDFVLHLFSNIASRYDRLNAAFTLNQDSHWRKIAASKANVKADQSILDVCCGTGKLTISLAELVGDKGQVLGLDFCESMLQKAKENIDATPYKQRITLMQGNALCLPFADNSFDCVTIGFGLRNVSDIEKALSEMYRVVKPGGTVLSVELSKPSAPILKQLYYFYFERILPFLGNLGLGKSSPYYNLPASLKTLPHQSVILGYFSDTGLKQVYSHELTGGIATIHVGLK